MVYYGNAHKYTTNKGCYQGYRRPRNTQIPKHDPSQAFTCTKWIYTKCSERRVEVTWAALPRGQ